jgi:hypothetical protein
MSDQLTLIEVRDRRGRWRQGQSGNPAGRPRGSKNGHPRRAASRERAADWTKHDWRIFFDRAKRATEGADAERHGAAVSECTALWLSLHPPVQRAGVCAHCGKTLDPPISTVNAAPIRADGAWIHWGCLPWFQWARWGAAKAGLQRLGLPTE